MSTKYMPQVRMAEPYENRFDRDGHRIHHHRAPYRNPKATAKWEPAPNLSQLEKETLAKRVEAREKEEMRRAGVLYWNPSSGVKYRGER